MKALLSVSDKSGIVEFAAKLVQLGYEILSTGGTLKALQENNIKAIDIGEYTNSAELFNGRVKTLHPKIHGGILYRRDNKSDCEDASKKSIESIDIVCVNLYPFVETTRKTQDFTQIIENIDIGGPAMIRSAAKNFASVLVITNPSDYESVIKKLESNQNDINFRQEMMIKAYEHTAYYDSAIANYLNERFNKGFGQKHFIVGQKIMQTKYGENPHQSGALYDYADIKKGFWEQNLHIKKGEPSFNNLADINAALKLATSFGKESKAVSIIKHGNPCGFALKENLLDSYKSALACDSISAYGGVVAINGIVDLELANELNKIFVEVLICADITNEALKIFESKKRMKIFTQDSKFLSLPQNKYDFKALSGGFLLQDSDSISEIELSNATQVSKLAILPTQQKDLKIAYIVAALTKSNCVTYVKNGALVAIGMGMTSRVDASRAALAKAMDMGLDISGSCMASEAFFPFRDSIDLAAKVGVSAIIQPGGSLRDDEVIQASNEHNIAMYFTHTRHFLH